MHGATQAMAVPSRLPHEFREHAIHSRTFGDAVTVTTMVTAYVVVLGEIQAGTRGNGFLTSITMRSPLNCPLLEQFRRFLFEASYTKHRLEELQQRLSPDLRCSAQ